MPEKKEFAVSDHTGVNVAYTDDFKVAKQRVRELDDELVHQDIEGWAAVMRWDEDEQGYILYY